jgi:hypothetical protein
MKNLCLVICAVLVVLSCNNKAEEGATIISGKLISPKSQTVYLNAINHFDNMSEDYIIDSTNISANGEFKFNEHNLNSKLVSITTEKFKPYTYQIYSKAPQTYFFGNCEKFFTSIPTFYITNENTLKINWHQTSNIEVETSFDNYLYSEIYLGHLNKFLNWFEENFPEEVENSLKNPNSDIFYSNIFREYNEHIWNSKSLEYYKFTERYVNYNMNIQSKSFENYYQSTEKKES